MAGLTLDKVHSVEMLGGGVRMPRVKKILDEYFKASKLELGEIETGLSRVGQTETEYCSSLS